MSNKQEYRRVLNDDDGWPEAAVMFLPIFSISNPNEDGICRIVFDWGKSITNPHARIGFAILNSPGGQYIKCIVVNNVEYKIEKLKKCRSGRLAAAVKRTGYINQYHQALIKQLMAQEFPDT